ncbi:hybrid sensor histidine kinase/response regulator transcription factor [Dyadobacter luticola]|uniref:histidine kinase n=1 Tax=Dyadobacter luticola TaxID=1979387 RepID=A0A5R9KYQ9_9BACT|nr:hybrid sensor histidine kinase/response regulator transcription factor [Dyadobacter luticola]TLV01452.1 response regulator [Dyadobacter luticola]
MRSASLKYLFVFLNVFLFALPGNCQADGNDPQLNFTAITSMDGLSSNTVHTILKDRYGLVWFGTDDGLNKYDGTEFTIYRHDRANPTSLASNDISSLHEDKAGRIWVGTIQGSLHLYDRKKDAFKRILVNESVTAVTSDHTGQLWVATTTGLVLVDPLTFRLTRLSQRTGVPNQIRNELVQSLFDDGAGRMWIGTEIGLFLCDLKTKQFTRVQYEQNAASGNANQVKTITGDKTGHIWVGTFSGLYKFATDGSLLQTFRYQANDEHSISSDMVYAVAAENRETLWICTDGGLDLMHMETGKVTRYAPDTRTPFTLTNKSVRSILIDRQGIFWLGTYKGGVNKFDKNLTIFALKRSNPYDPHGLSAPFVTSFAEKKNGDLFVGTDGGGLNLYHHETNLFTKIPVVPKNKQACSGLAIMSMELAGDKLWIGSFQNGLFALDVNSGQYQQFTQGENSASLNNNDIFSLMTDRQGKLWIGTNGGGVNVFDPGTQQFERYFEGSTPLARRMIPLNGYIRGLLQDKNGQIWIGSHGTGLVIFDPIKRKSIHFDKLNSTLPGNNVLALLEDSHGNIWAGTGGEGLAKFDAKTRRFVVFDQKAGLASGVINKILEDAEGRIWVSTDRGVSYLDQTTKRFINYSQYNGLQNNTFILGAGIRTHDNLLYFGGIQGFNYLDTRELRQNSHRMPVVLKELRVGNKSITPADSTVLDEHISIAKSIHLDYKQNFTLSYAALNYSDPTQTVYRYRLNGFDAEWHDAGASKTAGYTNLNPGTYEFEVQAKNQSGDWGSHGTSVEIVVKPPFYMTIYAYIFYGLALFGLLFLIRHRGIQKLKNKFRQEELERETERKRELDAMKIKFLTNLSHEFRTPISLILAPLDQLLSRPVPAENTPHLQGIKRNARRLLNLVDQLLDFKNLQEHESKLETTQGEIVSFIQETSESFRYLSQTKGVEYIFESAVGNLDMEFDQNKIERIVLNLLSNAFKHTPRGGKVTLALSQTERDGHSFYIQVSDTGVGIPLDKQEKIFERFFQNDSSAAILNQGSGVGLSIVKEFVQMHGGSIRVESAPGEGSTFTVALPCHISAATSEKEPTIFDHYKMQETAVAQAPETTPAAEPSADILIIEDNDEFRHYLKSSLECYYKVIEATNGNEGWQKALSQHPQIIISDIAMPEMDGTELSRKIKADKRTAHIPIILLTASTGEEHELRGLSSGANDYLTKPFNFDILNAKINNLLLLNRLLKTTYSKQIDIVRPEPQMVSGNEKLLKEILAYIDENLTNSAQLSVEKMSKQLGMSRGTLYNRVLEITGQTPIEFIRTIKLEKAAILLEKSDLNVSQISYSTGFATPNYFAKSFKAKFNMLPSEYMHAKRNQQLV